jgi:hypothetical protein
MPPAAKTRSETGRRSWHFLMRSSWKIHGLGANGQG